MRFHLLARAGEEKRLNKLGVAVEVVVVVRKVDSNEEVEEEGNDKTIDEDEEDEVGVGEVRVVATVVLETSVEGERSSVIPLPNPLLVFNPDSGLIPIPIPPLLLLPIPPPT